MSKRLSGTMPSDRTCQTAGTIFVFLVLLLAECIHASGLPGLAATAYGAHSGIRAEVNDIRSTQNPVQIDFYSKKLPFSNLNVIKPKGYSSNFDLAALLSGERHQWSPYVLNVLEDECFHLTPTVMSPQMIKRMTKLIKRRYRVQMVVDGLPAINNGSRVLDGKCDIKFYSSWPKVANYQRGYYLGVPEKCRGQIMLNNHVHFAITLYRLDKDEAAFYETVTLRDGSNALRRKRRSTVIGRKSEVDKSGTASDLYLVVGVAVKPYSIDWAHKAQSDKGVSTYCREAPLSFYRVTPPSAATDAYYRTAVGLDADERDDFAAPDPEDDDNLALWDLDNENDDDYVDGDDDPAGPMDPADADLSDDGDDGAMTFDEDDVAFPVANGVTLPPHKLSFLTEWALTDALQLPKKPQDPITVHWTYSVKWKVDQNVKWATRWDAYFKNHPLTVKQSSYMFALLLSSAVIAALLSLVVAVLVRALRRDVFKSVQVFLSPEDERVAKEEENGWKSVRGDVFRAPPSAHLLSVLVSAGVQALLTLSLSVFFGLLGFAAPSNRGGMVSLLLLFFLLSSFVGGALCAWLSMVLGQPKRWMTIVELVFIFSGAVLSAFTIANIVLRLAGSSGALPVATMTSLYVLWICLYCPLAFVGAAMGFAARYKPSDKVTAVQRVIDYSKVWVLFRTPALYWYSGLPSFFVGVFLIKIIFNGLWGGVMFYVFGFMCVTGFLWVVSCALTSVSAVYYNLCGENHRWHWLSFFAPSSGGLPIAVFAVWYFLAFMRSTTLTAILIYFIYMAVVTYLYMLVSGAVGFLSSMGFVRFVYGSIKDD